MRSPSDPSGLGPASRAGDRTPMSGAALEVRGLSVAFKGLHALDRVDLSVPAGSLSALVGPNGAGKSTLLNAVGGFVRATAGTIRLDDTEIQGRPPHRMAALGIGRAFQFVELFRHMSVLDNLLLGRHLHMRAGLLAGCVFFGRSRREQAVHRERVEAIVEFLELERYRKAPVAGLPFGIQKLVSVARALALEPRLLLLDEPSSGMNRDEKENLARFLLRIKHELGITMLWVEHDLELVRDLADLVTVLDFGHRIAAGPPAVALREPRVIDAYLGPDFAARVFSGQKGEPS
jgi:branched-chain amino acid transport system ATP-binding protein